MGMMEKHPQLMDTGFMGRYRYGPERENRPMLGIMM